MTTPGANLLLLLHLEATRPAPHSSCRVRSPNARTMPPVEGHTDVLRPAVPGLKRISGGDVLPLALHRTQQVCQRHIVAAVHAGRSGPTNSAGSAICPS